MGEDRRGATLVRSGDFYWRNDFSGSVLNAKKWDLVQTGAGQTVTVANNELSIVTGTTINSETIIRSREMFQFPFRLLFAALWSQKIVNQEFYIELVSVDPTTGIPDGKHKMAFENNAADSATNTNMVYAVQLNGMTPLRSAAVGFGITQTGYGIYEVEARHGDVQFHSRPIDSMSGRSASFVRHQSIPDPNAMYKVQIRSKNLGTAPASATTFKLNFVMVEDFTELNVDLGQGGGTPQAYNALPVQVINQATANARLDANNTINADTATNLTASQLYTGTTRDGGASYQAFNRIRATVAQTAGLTPGHLIIEQSADATTWRETHKIPIPSDGLYRTFDFPWNLRYYRIKFQNGATAQTLFYLATTHVRSDGGTDFDKTISFVHSTTALGISGGFNGVTLDLGGNHSFNRHRATVFADQAGTLALHESRDGSTWRQIAVVAVVANTLASVEAVITGRYQRVAYANGTTAQGLFELQSALVRQ